MKRAKKRAPSLESWFGVRLTKGLRKLLDQHCIKVVRIPKSQGWKK